MALGMSDKTSEPRRPVCGGTRRWSYADQWRLCEVIGLYGKCQELGYRDSGGLFGCVDEDGPKREPRAATEVTNAMKGEASVADYKPQPQA